MRKQTKIVAALSATALLALGASAVVFAAGWDNSTGSWQYLDSDGNAVTNTWKKSGDYWFYLGSDGNMVTSDFIEDDDDTFYVNEDGVMVTNQWVANEDAEDKNDDADYRWMYFDSDGKALKNTSGKITKSKMETINGKKYLFDDNGYMLYGWLNENSTDLQTDDTSWVDAKYYYGGWDDGSAQTGWVQLTVEDPNDDNNDDDYWFYFNGDGKKQTGKKTINGQTYYLDKNDGHMIDGWVEATGSTVNEINNNTTASDAVYVNDDGSARKNQWIWAIPDENWIKADYDDSESSWFWAKSNGKLYSDGLKKVKGKTYAFDPYGRMVYDVVAEDDSHYYRVDTSDYNGLEWAKGTVGSVEFKGNGNGSDDLKNFTNLYYFSDNEKKDGSRKTGYVTVEFQDDTYQMYFGTNGKAYGMGTDSNTGDKAFLVAKIHKYVSNGVVLKANVDTSNYAMLNVKAAEITYASGTMDENDVSGKLLINSSGSVVKNAKGTKDNNDLYYWTDGDGHVKYVSDKKLTTTSNTTGEAPKDYKLIYSITKNDSTTYYFAKDAD